MFRLTRADICAGQVRYGSYAQLLVYGVVLMHAELCRNTWSAMVSNQSLVVIAEFLAMLHAGDLATNVRRCRP